MVASSFFFFFQASFFALTSLSNTFLNVSNKLSSPLAFGDRCVFQFKKLNDGLILLSTPHGT